MHKTERVADCQDTTWDKEQPTYVLKTSGVARSIFSRCWNGQTLEAYSTKFDRTVWMLLPCNQWSCRQCAADKIQKLSAKTWTAKPNRLLTLTIDPSRWDNPRQSFDGTRRRVPELIKNLRVQFGEVEYLRVTELTAKGWPHYHMMVRSDYIPHAVVKKHWLRLTGASVVDLRQVKNKFQTYTYLVKYLSKMHNLGWTNRHVSTSRNFFPPQPPPPDNPFGLKDRSIIEQNPGAYLYSMFRGASITELSHGVYALHRRESDSEQNPTPEPGQPVYTQSTLF